jgi:hypothetical protein
MADTKEIGKKLVELCRQQKNLDAIEQLYAPNIVSIEAMSMPDMPARMEGIDAIKGKNKWWFENHTVHGSECTGPFPNGDKFIVHFKYDTTPKAGPMAGKRMKGEEYGLYTVRNGKIVEEQFFYDMSGEC